MNRKISKYQALLRYFPDRPWSSEFGTFRTVRLVGRSLGDEFDAVRDAVARLIEPDYARKLDREGRMRRSRAIRMGELAQQRGTGGASAMTEPSQADEEAANAFLAGIRRATGGPVGAGNGQAGPGQRALSGQAIELRVVDDDSDIQAEVYPPLFLCEECHRYYLLDSNGAPNLNCPEHGGESDLRQLPLVFACARCANIEPLLPHSVQLRRLSPGRVNCPRGHGMYLDLASSLSNARWRCEDPNCDSGVNGRVTRWCSFCDISDEGLRNHETRSVMAPRSATGRDIMSPLTATFVRDAQGATIQLARLRALHRDLPGSFTLTTIDPVARRRLNHLGIREFFDVQSVQSILVTYGYRSLVRPRPDVPDRERYGHFFQPQPRIERFRAYAGITEGRGMILGLNTDRLAEIGGGSHRAGGSYETMATSEIAGINQMDFQELIATSGTSAGTRITRLLHTLEHAMRQSLSSVIGLDDFDSRILVSDGSILIFETRDLGDGGIRQLSRQSGLMLSWIETTTRILSECPQLCKSACIACVKPDNASCHGFVAHEFTRWMPPNILLDRGLAVHWLQRNAET